MPVKDPNRPDFAIGTINLTSHRLGARKVSVTDEFFAPVQRMLMEDAPVWKAGVYDDNGKWMDGWESRRKRDPGHDHAVIKLATSGYIVGFDIDTAHFTGNYAPAASIEACRAPSGIDETTQWTEILPKQELGGNSRFFFEVEDAALKRELWTHIRLHIYPDGGVARLRVYGNPHFDWAEVGHDDEIDLGFIFHGARALHWSDAHYGRPDKLLAPGKAINMGDGWETARRRGPGYDWAIIRLGHRGVVERIEMDTSHFKGNYPQYGELLGADLGDHDDYFTEAMLAQSEAWMPVLQKQPLSADTVHHYVDELTKDTGPLTHVRFNIFPDGGVSRLRLFGRKR